MIIPTAVAITILSLSQAGIPGGTATPLGQLLTKQGYVAVPMTKTDSDDLFTVPCRIGGESFRMLVDTGAEFSCVSEEIIRRLKLPLGNERRFQGIGGVALGREVVLSNGLCIGQFDTRQMMAGNMHITSQDLSGLNERLIHNKQTPIGGIFGHAGLKLCSAIIDYPSRTLYLRTPLAKVWPQIEGRWVAERKEELGKSVAIDPKTPPQVEFKNRQLTIIDAGLRKSYGVHALAGRDCLILAMFDPSEELKDHMLYNFLGLMKLSNGKLTLCLGIKPKMVQEGLFPFKTGPGGGMVLFEFQRAKP